ncbi:MAG: radical SAM protein [Gammaproteobacteria bacterium]|nr:radical SAM protein [Gammaproteobacteria bacterium]
MQTAITFGPVPSRRLGRSLGINNIPPKHCSYACRYCQVGTTTDRTIERREFYTSAEIVAAVSQHVAQSRERGEAIDYLTFVPDGEPTLDIHLGETIAELKPLGIPIAVISNASLLWQEAVRDALMQATWVSLKVDSVEAHTWRRVNRPFHELTLPQVLGGIETFARHYRGTLVSETMLLAGSNDDEAGVAQVATFLTTLPLACAYLAVPTRSTEDRAVHGPDEPVLTRAFAQFSAVLPKVELLIGYEGDAFAASGNLAADILSISAVHPLRRSALDELLRKNGARWTAVEQLLDSGELREVEHGGERFYARKLM